MVEILIVIAIVLVCIVAGILGFAATRPDTFTVHRSASMKAAPDKVFPHINDFHNWAAWSPYEKLDPNMKKTLSGAAHGKGAVYEWEGNSQAGKGRMEITDSSPSSRITLSLRFEKPFKADNTVAFTLLPQGEDFETGLANLKAITEK
jgi:hypothetical protein